jgi:glutamate synthase (NADPH/NADH) small chain
MDSDPIPAQQLARVAHEVRLHEKHAKAGGLMRYGIPDLKMEKHHGWRRKALEFSHAPEAVILT